ncbi:AcvB/VirJ family lysyl-phosphatidylglycerol hydrolase [Pokkaliibacter sp. MBI-7]|uniref:AcvB/VirJ family lysyl-phosphatidylglycerol hydrolase n=1 Tax=Pokkaliibacter sp. MBI-7 TaxID=3040600 RepID=UPI0024480075|nr:AcvB/VirJ family lysyl-phosphatidylglycerol hydrolase [Pokkaliibacter sp. MBI-7]MDH2435487.1 AcvB/VirJ family lysyl-phosphatidylglycerol hydrolase [Pokkaliibacter sp. MBI-7]
MKSQFSARRLWLGVVLCALLPVLMVSRAMADDDNGKGPKTVDVPIEGKPHAVAVVYSGDGGWHDLDKVIGEWLGKNGYAVVGVDTLNSFWSSKEPRSVAKDLKKIVHRIDPTDSLPVLIVGYSFGADVFPFAWPELDPALKSRIQLVSLLAPGYHTAFHVSVEGWLGIDHGDHDVVPAIAALPAEKVLCVYGSEDKDDTSCMAPELKQISVIETSGDHHFDEDYPALAARINNAFNTKLESLASQQGGVPAAASSAKSVATDAVNPDATTASVDSTSVKANE